MNNLLTLINYGQSYWLDNLTREKIINGELKRRVLIDGLRGVTTNPTIFNNAISKSNYYDDQIIDLVNQIKNIQELYEELAVKDVQSACNILWPVYVESNGVDGFVSLEVSPHLAYDTEETKAEARRLFNKLDRTNCFIKIPATTEGIQAVEEMLFEGININVTLIFSVNQYRAVADAYINAIERRMALGKEIDKIRSVASFFLSRIDVAIDNQLTDLLKTKKWEYNGLNPKDLLGKAAIASAKMAYKEFVAIFSGKRWNSLTDKGAYVQRPLWASTGNKNPNYSNLKYVENLVVKNTVTTLPDSTISAFADHGVIIDSFFNDINEAEIIKHDLNRLGIDMELVAEKLLKDGVEKFKEDFNMLLKNLIEKRSRILENAAFDKG